MSTPHSPGLARQLVDRFRHLVHELGKFGVVGFVALGFDGVVFNGCLWAGMERLLATTVATVVSATVAFVGNRFWTWRHHARSGLRREYALYFLLNLVGLAINLVCVYVSHYQLGQVWPVLQTQFGDNLAKYGAGLPLGTVFRFWAYRRYVFRAAPAVPAPDAHAPVQVTS